MGRALFVLFCWFFLFLFGGNHVVCGTPAPQPGIKGQHPTVPQGMHFPWRQREVSPTCSTPGVLLVVFGWRTPTEMRVHQYSAEAFSWGLPWTQICHLVIVTASETPVYLFEVPAYPCLGGKFVLNCALIVHWSLSALGLFCFSRNDPLGYFWLSVQICIVPR